MRKNITQKFCFSSGLVAQKAPFSAESPVYTHLGGVVFLSYMTYYFRLLYSGVKKTMKILMSFNAKNWFGSPLQKKNKEVGSAYLLLGNNSNEKKRKK